MYGNSALDNYVMQNIQDSGGRHVQYGRSPAKAHVLLANLIHELCVAQLTSQSPQHCLLCLSVLPSVQCQQSQVAPNLSMSVVHDVCLHKGYICIAVVLQAQVGNAGAQPRRRTGSYCTCLLHTCNMASRISHHIRRTYLDGNGASAAAAT